MTPDAVGVLQQAAATVSALTVLAGAAAYLLRPRIVAFVRAQQHSAATVAEALPGAAEQVTLTAYSTVATGQRLDDLARELGDLRGALCERLDALEAVLIKLHHDDLEENRP